MKKRTIFMGYSLQALQAIDLHKDFSLVLCVGVKGRMSDEYYSYIKERKIDYIELNAKKELEEVYCHFSKADVILIHLFEYILSNDVVENNRIINFHPGDLRSNRGAHAAVWSVLLQERTTCLSCYELKGGVDEGLLISSYQIDINDKDTPKTLYSKMAVGIPHMLDDVYEYLHGRIRAELVTGGAYRRKIRESDFVIDPEHDSLKEVIGKVQSQKSYYGAVLYYEGEKYRVSEITIIPGDKKDCPKQDGFEDKGKISRIIDGRRVWFSLAKENETEMN